MYSQSPAENELLLGQPDDQADLVHFMQSTTGRRLSHFVVLLQFELRTKKYERVLSKYNDLE